MLTVVRDETVATEDPVSVDGSFVGYTTDVERIARVGTDDTLRERLRTRLQSHDTGCSAHRDVSAMAVALVKRVVVGNGLVLAYTAK